MPLPSTMTPIATISLSGSQSANFTNIPQTYTDLVLVVNGIVSADSNVYMRYNGDTGSNYSITNVYGTGSSALSTRQSSQAQILISLSSYFQTSVPGNMITSIQNYSNATTYKTAIGRFNSSGVVVQSSVSLWRSTAAITRVEIYSNQGNFNSGSTFTLYGIKAAS